MFSVCGTLLVFPFLSWAWHTFILLWHAWLVLFSYFTSISLHLPYMSSLLYWGHALLTKILWRYLSASHQWVHDANTYYRDVNFSYLVKMIFTAAAKLLQSCPTLCNPIECSPPGSPVPGILQARTLEWVAISFPNAWKWKVKVKSLSRVQLLATPWTAAHQAPPPMGFSRQEYWSGVRLPSLDIY